MIDAQKRMEYICSICHVYRPVSTTVFQVTKGQIKSEWIYEVSDFPNQQLQNLKDFCPESFEVEYL